MRVHADGKLRLAALVGGLIVVGAALSAEAQSPRVSFGRGKEVEVQIVPDGSGPLPFRGDRTERWVVDRDMQSLVGRQYSIRLENRSNERIKVVVSVDGLNAFFKRPVEGRSSRDPGAILGPYRSQVIAGWQLDRSEAQRFVFSPRVWSEGQAVDPSQVGYVEIHVYRESQRRWGDFETDRSESEGGAAGARPRVGTGSGEDFENEVRRVDFRTSTEEPVGRAVLQYGRQATIGRPDRLGVTVDQLGRGLRVTDVEPGTLAEEIGLREGDVITTVDGDSAPTTNDLRSAVRSKQRGDSLFLKVDRGRHRLTIQAIL